MAPPPRELLTGMESSLNPSQQVSPRQRDLANVHSISLMGVTRWAVRSLFHVFSVWHAVSAPANESVALGSAPLKQKWPLRPPDAGVAARS
jgi:hypothetical protein